MALTLIPLTAANFDFDPALWDLTSVPGEAHPLGSANDFLAGALRTKADYPAEGTYWVKGRLPSDGSDSILSLTGRYDGSRQIGAFFYPKANGGNLVTFRNNNSQGNAAGAQAGGVPLPAEVWMRVILDSHRPEGAGPTAVFAQLYQADRTTTMGNGVATGFADDGTTPNGAGKLAIAHFVPMTVLAVGYESSGPPALVDGTLAVSNVTATSATVTGTADSGGTPPYAYDWTDAAGNHLATTADLGTLTGLTPSTAYTYTRSTHDSGNPQQSHAESISFTTSAAPVPPPVGQIGDFDICQAADSIGANAYCWLDIAIPALEVVGNARTVTLDNQAIGGTDTSQWTSTGQYGPAFFAHVAQTKPALILYGFGTNNNKAGMLISQADTQAHAEDFIDHCRAASPTSKIAICAAPTPANPINDTGFSSADGVSGYHHTPLVNAGLAAAAASRGVPFEGTSVFDKLASDPSIMPASDIIHPAANSTGAKMLAGTRVALIAKAMGLSPAPVAVGF